MPNHSNQTDYQPPSLDRVHRLFLYGWITLIISCLYLYFFHPELFSPDAIRNYFSENLYWGLFAYFVISTVRGFTLIPSTPIVLAGVLVFPPIPLWIVNQMAVYSSSAIVYLMAQEFQFDRFFHQRYPKQIDKLTELLKQRELLVISAWGFAPFVPTDMIVYVCSILQIRLWKTLLGVSIGEGIICAIYIFGGSSGVAWLSELMSKLTL
jgi:uncharacterized membrane protein YdjX (TVP38/TMEM64 family)